jgi:outer membrane protein assembly factor BamB
MFSGMWRCLGVAATAGILVAAGAAGVTQVGFGVAEAAGAGFGSNWTLYHQNGLGSGVDPSGTVLNPAALAWTSPVLDGQIYGEPLVEDGRVIVATENNTVYALAANTGAVIWKTHIATSVPSGDLPCGDIAPTVGITSTPVIDPARNEIFVVDDQLTGAKGASHHLVGLDLLSGELLLNTVADPPGSHPLEQLQRPGLTLDAGQVIISFGGNSGDCEPAGNPYHGWLAAIPETGGPMRAFEVASQAGDSQGAIWMGGAAPIVDSAGNIWVSTGNSAFASAGRAYDNSDGVLEVGPALGLKQFFAPSSWPTDNLHDLDLGSSSPSLIAGGLVLQAGKSRIAYVMSESSLGGVGKQLASVASYCGSTVDGGSAIVGDTVYTPCEAGIVRTDITPGSPPTITSTWQTSTGSGGPPIIAGGLVWTIDESNGTLYALDPATGAVVQSFGLGSISNHFPTPSVADGLLLAPAGDAVKAFEGPAGLPPAPAPPTFTLRPGSATDVSVGANGSVWAVGSTPSSGPGNRIYHWTGNGWTAVGGAAVRISVDAGGNPWAVDADDQIYHLGPTGWSHLGGSAIDISIGASGSLWAIGSGAAPGGFGIYHWNGQSWVQVPGGAVRIAVDPSGNPWVINSADEIFQWVAGRFVLFPGSAREIGVGADGEVWIIGTNPMPGGFGVFRGIGTGFAEVPGAAASIGVDPNGFPWIVNSADQIFSY